MNHIDEAYEEFDLYEGIDESLLDAEDYDDESFDDEAFDAKLFRTFLGESYQDLPDEEVLELFEESMAQMSPEEAEFFGKIWKGIKKGAKVLAKNGLSKLGGYAGSVIGGPIGGAIGTKLGGSLSGLIDKGGRHRRTRRRPQPRRRPATQPRYRSAPPPPRLKTSATGQLMGLLTNPVLTQALMGQVIGQPSRKTVPLVSQGQTKNVPYGAIMKLLSNLAKKAAGESYEIGAEETPDYLMDGAGEFATDPADEEARMEQLLEMINETAYLEEDDDEDYDDDDDESYGYDDDEDYDDDDEESYGHNDDDDESYGYDDDDDESYGYDDDEEYNDF